MKIMNCLCSPSGKFSDVCQYLWEGTIPEYPTTEFAVPIVVWVSVVALSVCVGMISWISLVSRAGGGIPSKKPLVQGSLAFHMLLPLVISPFWDANAASAAWPLDLLHVGHKWFSLNRNLPLCWYSLLLVRDGWEFWNTSKSFGG
jgi:hypothetical protein